MIDLLILLFALTLTTWLLADPLCRFRLTPPHPIFPIILAIVSYSVVSLALVRLGQFSVARACILLSACVALVRVILIRYPRSLSGSRLDSHQAYAASGSDWCALLVIVALGFLYLLFPTYYLHGGRDPGAYLIDMAHFARTGGDTFFSPIENVTYPGFYFGDDPHRPLAQFMHLFPATGATLFSIFGLEGAVRTNGILAIFALSAFYTLLRQLLPFRFALIATICLGINPAFLFVARGPYSEVYAVLLFALGSSILIHAIRTNRTASAILAGFVIGLTCLVRLDGILASFVVVGIAAAVALHQNSRSRLLSALALSFSLSAAIGYSDAWVNSSHYLRDLLRLTKLSWVLWGCGLILAAAAFTPHIPRFNRFRLNKRLVRFGLIATPVALSAYFIFALTLLPDDPNASATLEQAYAIFKTRSMIELGWYMTIPGLILFLYGIWALLHGRSWARWAPILSLAILCFLVFTIEPSITPDHPWASRRWVSYLIPTIIAISAYGVYYSTRRRGNKQGHAGRFALAIVVLLYLMNTLAMSRPFIGVPLLKGWAIGFDSWVRNNPWKEGDQFYHSNAAVAATLNYLYNMPVLPISSVIVESESVAQFPASGTSPIRGLYPYQTFSEFPSRLRDWWIEDNLTKAEVRRPQVSFDEEIDFSDPSLSPNFLLNGWSRPGKDGVWTDDRQSSLILELPPTESGLLALEISYVSAPSTEAAKTSFSVALNGSTIGNVPFGQAKGITQSRFEFTRELLKNDGKSQIDFAFTNLRSPAELGLSSDHRRLGIRLRNVRIVEDPFQILPGEQIIDFSNVGNSRQFVLTGFGQEEGWGRWIVGHSGVFALNLNQSWPVTGLRMKIHHRLHLTPLNNPIKIQLLVGGTKVGQWTMGTPPPSGPLVVDIPTEISSYPLPTKLEFRIENPISPASAGNSNDTRALGLGISKIELLEGSEFR